eukprot:TRINITY_DN22102_c0_g1_i1.p1 TRINITY_DN22102_c0_g1~~TRINITY_DN22102_c0_g1_i1.p1  ORF type:complete len:220 (+),score=72.24 TRINITY_DN22102_c0_g1_i1:62-661(+)
MEMLAEMEGSEETLRGLNDAEHRPEDSMQTDEWMYELKHRKSWATGKYIPSSEGDLKVSKEGEEGGVPPNWQERLSQEQINMVKDMWCIVGDKKKLALEVHEKIVKIHPEARDLVPDEQAQKIIKTIDTTVNDLTAPSSKPSTILLTQLFKDYRLTDQNTYPHAVISAMAATLGDKYTPAARDAWCTAYMLLSSAVDEE